MGKKRVLIGYGIDVDAVSGCHADPTDVSRGVFGATVGIDRLLKLWERYHIKTSWFVPAHSIESFPEQIAKVRDAGHEIGLHGYTHEFVSTLTEDQQRDVLRRSINVLTSFVGKKPRGWTAPAWATSRECVKLLEEFGIEYDHSFMHHDFQLYYLPHINTDPWKETDTSKDAETWMVPMSAWKDSSVVEIPANWHLDDWPPFQFSFKGPSHGYVDPWALEKLWRDQFSFCYREYDTFIFPISIHPQVSGKPQVLLMHERFIEFVNGHEGVEWVTMDQMVDEFKAGNIQGATVKGGQKGK
ncbi:hypothetical protein AYO20_07213 [Fonsecaea nubica]|uniref:NodB homology domain-containing protein n=1 Tax=Fonsecaea nubica TaxID=856822 RepID=A0A178CVN2_9EURO|nr:hypothetical protein AYO20_07213 [Fonsecaea nubica]OAL33527.1 hypothetical protein AYO20_07213 [Fonsecaea nubica]